MNVKLNPIGIRPVSQVPALCEPIGLLKDRPAGSLRTAFFALFFTICSGCTPKAPPPTPPQPSAPLRTGETVNFTSTPKGATVTLPSGESCQTPCSLELNSPEPFEAVFEKEGYRAANVAVTTNIELLRDFNERKGVARDSYEVDSIPRVTYMPNPVTAILTRDRTKNR